jgi:hypothetical protein
MVSGLWFLISGFVWGETKSAISLTVAAFGEKACCTVEIPNN